MSKPSKRVAVRMPTVEEDKVITAAARTDPDTQPLTQMQLKAMLPARSLRGRPPSPNKRQLVSIRYSPEVLDFFKATGDGWQSRIDGVLKQYVSRRVRRAQGEV